MNHKLPPIYRRSWTCYMTTLTMSRYVQLVIRSLMNHDTLSCKNLSDILYPIHKVTLLFFSCAAGLEPSLQLSFLDLSGSQGSVAVGGSCTGKPRKRLMFSTWQWGFAAPRVSLLSFSHMCYATNMSGNQFFPEAQNFVIRGGTFMAADIVCDAVEFPIPLILC